MSARKKRIVWCSVGLLSAWAVLVQLSPAAAGVGTHEQLGLPPCPFHWLTGYPCPACGLTTSWCYLSHGEWAAAWRTHLLGPLIPVGLLSWALFDREPALLLRLGLFTALVVWAHTVMRLSGLL